MSGIPPSPWTGARLAALATEKSGSSGTSSTLADNTAVVFQGVTTLTGASFV